MIDQTTPQHVPVKQKYTAGWVTIGAGTAAVLGSFLPWITVTAPFVGTISKSGTDGLGDGWIVVVLGLALLYPGILLVRGRLPRWEVTVFAVALLGMAAFELVNVAGRISSVSQSSGIAVSATIGNGLWLVCAAGLTAWVGVLLAWLRV